MEQESQARWREDQLAAELAPGSTPWSDRDPPVQLPDAPDRPTTPMGRGRALALGSVAALRHRDFRLFYSGQILSLVGTWMQSTAQGWLVLELTDSELLLGLVTAAGSIPILLFTLYAGVVADRRDKRDIILAAQCASLVLALALAALTSTGAITLGWLLALVFLLGIANAFEIPTRQSFFVDLVGKEDLSNAIALNSSAFNLTRVVGPALAGMLIGSAGIAACFYANAVSYLAVIAVLLAMPRRPARQPAAVESLRENLGEGVRFIFGQRLTTALVGLVAVSSIFGFPYAMLLPVFARDILHVGPQGLGWLLSATGAGALAGGITLAVITGRVRRGPLLLASAASFAVLIGAFSLSRSLPLSLVLLAGAGFAVIPFSATVNALLQSLVPDELRGRVMGVYVFMFLGMSPLGSLQAGAMARWLGAPAALSVSAAIFLIAIGLAWERVPELRAVR
ncbi:MAG: MFS transporter [Gemmatimonadetes bacterium]|nr:MFS transporter [Gemmatimonadota bacterium]